MSLRVWGRIGEALGRLYRNFTGLRSVFRGRLLEAPIGIRLPRREGAPSPAYCNSPQTFASFLKLALGREFNSRGYWGGPLDHCMEAINWNFSPCFNWRSLQTCLRGNIQHERGEKKRAGITIVRLLFLPTEKMLRAPRSSRYHLGLDLGSDPKNLHHFSQK